MDEDQLNNLNKSSSFSKNTPDLLRNLNQNAEEKNKKNYEKHQFNENTKPLNTDYPLSPVGELVEVQDSLQERYTMKRKVKKGFCIMAWIVCCPVMCFGYMQREKPDPNDPDDFRDDPCVPCYYDTSYNPRDPNAPKPKNKV